MMSKLPWMVSANSADGLVRELEVDRDPSRAVLPDQVRFTGRGELDGGTR
jgi:hypothetical protein